MSEKHRQVKFCRENLHGSACLPEFSENILGVCDHTQGFEAISTAWFACQCNRLATRASEHLLYCTTILSIVMTETIGLSSLSSF
jgi:hypothetical protein